MSLGKILNFGIKKATNFTKLGATKLMTQDKSTFVSDLLKLPLADEFVKSCTKQNAHIIADNIARVDGVGIARVITKRLPSGTTVTNVYSPIGELAGKEVISKAGRSRSYRSGREFVVQKNNGKTFFKRHLCNVESTNTKIEPNTCYANSFKNITASNNADNEFYQQLLKHGMVYA